MRNIYIIGYRGTGKTTVSELLGSKLKRKVIHMDIELINEIGKIDVYVRNFGWNSFRDEETKLLEQISKEKNLIVDCGGGIIVRDENIEIMKKTGKCIWLKANVKSIVQRLEQDKNKRPALTRNKSTIDEVEEVLSLRLAKYKSASNIEIDTDGKSIEEISDELILKIK